MPLDIASALLSYYSQYKELEEKGGPEQDGDLFEQVLGKEEAILSAFGLPESLKFCQILHQLANRKTVNKAAIQKTMGKLREAAEKYHQRPVTSSLTTLTQAQQQKLRALDVLPELGFLAHSYTIFLYDTLLLGKKADPAAILQELQTLKEQQLYGPVAKLHFNLKPNYRRTKAYRELKASLQFLDLFLAPEKENKPKKKGREEKMPLPENLEALFKGLALPPQPEVETIQNSFQPEYTTMLEPFELQEIIFSKDSAVSAIGRILHTHDTIKTITLGFEFDQLTALLGTYGQKGQSVLSYFNRDRQQNATDEPVFLHLKDKTGSTLLLDQHYFKVYKPLSLDRNGRPGLMAEAFYIVEKVLDKSVYDRRTVMYAKIDLEGYFHHMRNHYYAYQNYRRSGMTEQEARKKTDLEDPLRFKVSRLLYKIWKHGSTLR